MKIINYFSICILLINISATAQKDSSASISRNYHLREFTIEPGIGIKPWPMADLVISNLSQWNVKKRVSIIAYTSYSRNSAFLRNFNHIKTNYNFSLGQKFGIGTSLYTKHTSHTFSVLAGIKYDAFKETLDNPEFEKVTASVKSVSPDFGLMYHLKVGNERFFLVIACTSRFIRIRLRAWISLP